MASSRTEKIGTVFSRIDSLLKANALQKENIPVWYNIYKTFPPKYEPIFGRPLPQKDIQKIFYAEDYIRAEFYKCTFIPPINLKKNNPSPVKVFIHIYEDLLKNNVNADEAYNKAIELTYKNLNLSPKRSTSE